MTSCVNLFRFVNLATIPESQRLGVQLVECPVKSDAEMDEAASATTPADLDRE